MIATKKISSCLWCHSQEIFKQNCRITQTRDFTSDSNQTYKYVRCASCNSLNLIDQPIESELKKIYDAGQYDPYKTKRTVSISETDKRVKSYFNFDRRLKILDYGAGSGDYLYKMSNIFPGSLLYAVDFDVEAAKRRLEDLDVTVISPDQYTNSKHEFDHINISHCLEHLPNPIQVLSKLVSELKTGGILIIRSPVADSFSSRFFQGYWFGLEAPRHFAIPSRKIFEHFLPFNFNISLLRSKYYGSPIIFMRSVNYYIPNNLIFRKVIIKLSELIVSKFSNFACRYELSSKAEFFYKKD